MTETLYEWLKFRWSRDNHNKYQEYFELWITNITQSQIEGFTKQESRRNVWAQLWALNACLLVMNTARVNHSIQPSTFDISPNLF